MCGGLHNAGCVRCWVHCVCREQRGVHAVFRRKLPGGAYYLLLATFYLLLATFYLLLTTHYSLLTTDYLLLITYY